jgi:hypothetical protein
VSGGPESAPITVRWLADPPASMSVSPATTSWFTDAQVGITADVRDGRGYPVDPTPVDFVATMPGSEQAAPVRVTTGGGRATASFTSNRPGRMTVTATVGNLAATSTVDWVVGPPPPPPTLATAITLDPPTATLGPGHVLTVTATVTGEGGRAVRDGTPIAFTMAGPSGSGTICTPPVGFTVAGSGAGMVLYGDGRTDTVTPSGRQRGATRDLTGAVDLAAKPYAGGYWVVTADGRVEPSGTAVGYGDARDWAAANPVRRIAATPSGNGYWLLHDNGEISAFGDAGRYGSPAGRPRSAPLVALMATPTGAGYWVVAANGTVYAYGDAAFFGDLSSVLVRRPIVDAIPTTSGRGYWLAGSDGGLFSFGDAAFYGSLGSTLLPAPVTRMARSVTGAGYYLMTGEGGLWSFGDAPTLPNDEGCRSRTTGGRASFQFTSAVPGHSEIAAYVHEVSATSSVEWREGAGYATSSARAGYWMLGADGRVFAFGDAGRYGEATIGADVKAVDLEPTPARLGYWIFTSRGRVMPFGDARFFGDTSAMELNGPVLDSIPTPSGAGYYMVASDGGIFAFGDARFAGSMGGRPLNKPVQSLVPDRDGSGYWLVASDGGIFAFDAPFRGSMGDRPLNKPVTGMVRYGDGYLMVATDGGIFAFSDKSFAGSLGASPPAQPIVSVAATG